MCAPELNFRILILAHFQTCPLLSYEMERGLGMRIWGCFLLPQFLIEINRRINPLVEHLQRKTLVRPVRAIAG